MEADLIRLCAHPGPNQLVRKSLSQLSIESINWEDALHLARHNEIIPLIYSRLSEFDVNVPAEKLQNLRSEANAIVGWNLKLAGEMVLLLNLFREAGINVVPFKGPALVCALYGGLKLRQCRDLDLLIERQQMWDAVHLLQSRGYQLDRESSGLLQNAATSGLCKDLLLVHSENYVNIDLHWAACEPDFDETLAATNFWSDCTTITVLGESVPLPKPEDLLVLLVIHGSRHYWHRLKLLADIARLLTVYKDLDLQLAMEKLPGTLRTRMLLIPLAVAHDLWHVDLPTWVLVLIENQPTIREEAKAILQRIFAVSSDDLGLSRKDAASLVSRESLRLSSLEASSDRRRVALQVLKRMLVPNQLDERFNKLPARSRPFLYIVRPVRLVRTYGLGLCLASARKVWRALTISRKK